jgi:hypothetical protein
MVELGRFFPTFFRVATAAILSKRFLVFVILFVAREALLAQLFTIKVARVAVFASRISVLAAQAVFGVRIVVEVHALPLLGAVAGVALLPELTLVTILVVVGAMAAVAVLGRIFVDVVDVAICTFGRCVLTRE